MGLFRSLRAQKVRHGSQTLDTEVLYTVGSLVSLLLDGNDALVLPSWSEKLFKLFCLHKN